jgi:hypothetical protein
MKNLTSLLAMLALVGSAGLVQAQDTAAAEDDCKEQSSTDDDACAPAVPVAGTTPAPTGGLGGLGGGAGAAIGIGALAIVALAGSGSGGHSGSH